MYYQKKINFFVMCAMFRTDSYVIQRHHSHRIIGSESNRTRCQIITAAHETGSSNESDTPVTRNSDESLELCHMLARSDVRATRHFCRTYPAVALPYVDKDDNAQGNGVLRIYVLFGKHILEHLRKCWSCE